MGNVRTGGVQIVLMVLRIGWTLDVTLVESTKPPTHGRMGRPLVSLLIAVAFLSHHLRDRAG